MDKKAKALVLTIKRLVHAQAAFKRVKAMATHLEANASEQAEWRLTATCGMCTEYMRPFLRADGLGPLPSRYSEFEDPDLAGIHLDVSNGRHWLFAHHDALNVSKLLTPNEAADFDMIKVHIHEGQKIQFGVPQVRFDTSKLHLLVNLCALQIKRTHGDLLGAAKELFGTKKYPPGTYILGKDIP